MTEESTARDLLAALEVAVLEQDDDGSLRVAGSIPEWFARFRPGSMSVPPRIEAALGSAFLENFLVEAEGFWDSEDAGRLRSGMWTEAGPDGDDFHLEASAVRIGRRRFLVIEDQTPVYDEKQSVLQRARSQNLSRRERRREEENKAR
ncbi:MAG TPA: hypothetical protein VKG01_15295 [Thermoanaerobaculia bacterium]|nr:hypothetical protein [Thermoanaerobaculia bacterium]